ncbi:MAG TPA: tRNA epoxyqueuosine(34) reductase QueG [Planctomycetaceae bacterium]|nr:tRNA epoxyqueuosine(34) reductase QueG [Planctomycetaceae bacterium]
MGSPAPTDFAALTNELKAESRRLGFPLSGVSAAAMPGRLSEFHAWLDAGYAGQMRYLEQRREAYSHPRHVLDGCTTILMLGMPYTTKRLRSEVASGNFGKLARYAASDIDYHDLIHSRLKLLKSWLVARVADSAVRGVVDTAPILERDFAERAGLGWIGKNTLVLNKYYGSYFFLAALLTSVPLTIDEPDAANHCGTCTACLQACPTQAFPRPFELDGSKCISYLTIELREPVPSNLADNMQDWTFGCDVCQEVCPWNRKAIEATESALTVPPERRKVDLASLLEINEEEFRRQYRKTALWRTRRSGVVRNAIITVANLELSEYVPQLTRLLHDEEMVVRETAAWAIKRLQVKSGDYA